MFVALRIDFDGLHSLDGGRVFISGFEFHGVLANDGGLIYRVHGEKLTRFDCRVEGSPAEPLTENGEAPGVCKITGESSV